MSDLLRIGSRGSALALVQSRWVADELSRRYPRLRVEIEVIKTKGDKLLESPLAMIGEKGLFVKELETAMRDGRVDLAVHSAKDMPTVVPEGLCLAAFTAREDVHDVFVARRAAPPEGQAGDDPPRPRTLAELPAGAVVGSSSLRRRSQLLALRPDLELVDIRGNVQTRLRKVAERDMAGTVLAAAGLARLSLGDLAAFTFGFDEMLPAVGQGALALETRDDDERVRGYVEPLGHAATALAVRAERSLMRELEGGCQVPIAGYAAPLADDAGRLLLRACVGSLDGSDRVRDELVGPAAAPEELGRRLAERLRAAGAGRILAAVRGDG